MRAGEFTCPTSTHFDPESMRSPEDVSVDQCQSPSLLCVKLKCSKADPFRTCIAILLGRVDDVLCPVGAVLAYLAIHSQHLVHSLCLKMAATSQTSALLPTFTWGCIRLNLRQTDIAVTVLGLVKPLLQLKME